jgi:hypothetical protein
MFVRYMWALFSGFFIALQPSAALAENDNTPIIAGSWYEDPERSDDLRRFLMKNFQYIDVTAVRFRGTRRGVVVGGNYRRNLSDRQVNELLDFLGSVIPLKPVIGIEQAETEVSLLYAGNEVRQIRLHGPNLPETRQSTAGKQDQNLVLAAWEEGGLVIETNSSSGVSVIERISVDKSEEVTLRIETVIDTPRLPANLVFNRYYKPYPPLP